MGLQYNGRAVRAIAALVAAVIAVAAFGAVASASTAPASRAGHSPAHRRVPGAAPVARRSRPRHVPRGPRPRHVPRGPVRLQAVLLRRDVLVGQDVTFAGMTRPGAARRLIGVQQRLGSRWVDVAHARTNARGRFLAHYRPRTLGRIQLRVRLAERHGWGATVPAPVATVFHEAVVSWYGPGGTTACGEPLGAATAGVANLTLPCGTLVTLRYRGRTVRVPVIDRGPYVAGREYDLTYATKLALGAGDVSVVWASA